MVFIVQSIGAKCALFQRWNFVYFFNNMLHTTLDVQEFKKHI
jgi:hypothetical protein